MRAATLHHDVIVVTSGLLQVNCTIVRGPAASAAETTAVTAAIGSGSAAEAPLQETFVIDSPVLPDELAMLGSLVEQSRFPAPSGLLATHADWDHLLGPLAFPGVPLGCAESSAARLSREPGGAQRELRAFDENLYLERPRPLALGSVQGLPVPGRCEIGGAELDLYAAEGHTADGMALWVPWAGTLVAGDYLSAIEIPTLAAADAAKAYLATLARLRPLVELAEHVVPGHGPVLDAARALAILDEDVAYVRGLARRGADAELPEGRRSREQRRLHERNVALSRNR